MTTHPFIAQRAARRLQRLAKFSPRIGQAVKEATSGWDLSERLNTDSFERPATLPETIRRSIAAVRRVLNDIGGFPMPPQIEYQNVRNVKAAAGGTERTPLIGDGVIMLTARFMTKTGVRDSFDVPVMIRQGQVVSPSVAIHDGRMKVLSPSSVEDMLVRGTFQQEAPPRGLFSAPMTHEQVQQQNQLERQTRTRTRLNPGMFSVSGARELVRAAVQGDAQFKEAQRVPPGRAAMGMQASPAGKVGDRVVTEVTWNADVTDGMSDNNIKHTIESFVRELGTKPNWRNWGTVADVQIESIDRDAGKSTVNFASSEVSAPQLSAADLEDINKSAAVGPSQDETDLDPAEREPSKYHVGESVKLTKGQLLRNRGGGTDTIPKGTKGRVIGDLFGDGLTLKVVFDSVSDEPMVIPASHVKHASTLTTEKVLGEIENLRKAGYSPIDVILSSRKRYGELGESALKRAKALGLLDW